MPAPDGWASEFPGTFVLDALKYPAVGVRTTSTDNRRTPTGIDTTYRDNQLNYTARQLRRACATPLWGGNEYWLCNICYGIMLVYYRGKRRGGASPRWNPRRGFLG